MSQPDSNTLQLQLLEKEYYLVTKKYEKVRIKYIQSLQNAPVYNSSSKYKIVGLGLGGNLWVKETMDSPWVLVDASIGGFKSICTGPDGDTIYGVNEQQSIMQKSNYKEPWSNVSGNTCCVTSIAMAKDGTLFGIGTDQYLYRKNTVTDNWTTAKNPNIIETLFDIAISPSGVLYCLGLGDAIYKKESYKNTENQMWQYVATIPNINGLAFTPDDILVTLDKDGNMYSNSNYKTNFAGGISSVNDSCCVISIAFVNNPDSTYNVGKYMRIQGSTFWGASELKTQDSISMEDCEALCSADEACTGATYNPIDHDGISYCWTRQGDGYVGGGLENDYALVDPSRKLAQEMTELDLQLNTLSNQIQQEIQQITPLLNTDLEQKDSDKNKLQDMYSSLQEQRALINEQMMEMNKVEQEYNDTNTYVTQKNMVYIFLSFIVLVFFIIMIFMLMRSASNMVNPGSQSLFNLPYSNNGF